MAKHMRAYSFADAGVCSQRIDYLPEAGPGHGGSPVAQKEVRARFFLKQGWPALFKVVAYAFTGYLAERDYSLLVSFSHHPHLTTGKAAVGHR